MTFLKNRRLLAMSGGFLLLTGFLLVAQKPRPTAKPNAEEAAAPRAPGGYRFEVIARVENNQGDKLGGLTVGGLGVGKTISLSDTGHVLFSAASEKGCTAFLDRTPVFYVGMEISGRTLLNCTIPILSRKGNYAFFVRYRETGSNGRTSDSSGGVVLDGKFVLTPQQRLPNGYTVSGIATQSLRFDESNRYVASVGADPPPNGGQTKRFRIVDGAPMDDVPAPPPQPLPKDAGSITASNSAHQLIYWSNSLGNAPRIKTAEGRVFPSASNNFAMNDLGQIFTADPMLLNYADAAEHPAPLPSADYYNRLLDLTPLTLQGMPPFRTEHGKPVYGFSDGDYGTVAINNAGQLAFYVFYAAKPGQNVGGSAVVLATPISTPVSPPSSCPDTPPSDPGDQQAKTKMQTIGGLGSITTTIKPFGGQTLAYDAGSLNATREDGFDWVIHWKLSQPSRQGGIIVQEMVWNLEPPYHYWEGWVVRKCESRPYTVRFLVSVPTRDRWKDHRTITYTGVARFYEGQTLPPTFIPGSVIPGAFDVPATYQDPHLESYNVPQMRRVLEWHP